MLWFLVHIFLINLSGVTQMFIAVAIFGVFQKRLSLLLSMQVSMQKESHEGVVGGRGGG